MPTTQVYRAISSCLAKHPYPIKQRAATAVQYGDTFAVAGGKTKQYQNFTTENSDAVYMFDPETEGWKLAPEKMVRPKHGVAAIPVGPKDFPPC